MKRIIYIIVFVLLISVFVPVSSYAQSETIRAIDTEVILEQDGTAKIKQVWDVSTHKGTEFFIPITQLNDMKLENFKVSDESGREFQFVENWNVKGSLEEKAFKNGINKTANGFELCWGKGSYGDHQYTVSWEYKNAVQAYTDYDGFNIRFINDKMSPPPKSVSIKISKPDIIFNNENTKIWAFGYKGEILFQDDGFVYGKSHKALGKKNYMNVMMRFEKGIFNPEFSNNYSFDILKSRAMKGATSFEESIFSSRKFYSYLIAIVLFIVLIFTTLQMNKAQKPIIGFYDKKRNNFRPINRPRKSKYKKIDYNRELPVENNITTIYYIHKLFNKKKDFGNLISAYILKWIKNDNVVAEKNVDIDSSISKNEDGKLSLQINKEPEFESITEKDIWEIIVKAAGEDGLLEEKEFEKFAKKEFGELNSWIDFALIDGGIKFLELGGLETIDNEYRVRKTQLTESGQLAIENYFGFKKFLKDFTIIDERDVKQVDLWDDYLIIATLMGFGNEVMKQMNSLIPNYVFGQGVASADGINYYNNLVIFNTVNSLGNGSMRGYTSGAISASLGDGGSSFSGGGGGFSGGGSGGGSR